MVLEFKLNECAYAYVIGRILRRLTGDRKIFYLEYFVMARKSFQGCHRLPNVKSSDQSKSRHMLARNGIE